MRKTILILTETYPYVGGDDWLADEIPFWVATGHRIILAPVRATSASHPIPSEVELDESLVRLNARFAEPGFLLQALFSQLFWREVMTIRPKRIQAWRTIWGSAKTVAKTFRSARGIRAIHGRVGVIDLAYAYWNDSESFAAARMREKGAIRRVVTRAHGYDLYAHRRPGNHLPVKAQIAQSIDRYFPISEEGRQYLLGTSGIDPHRVRVGRLGVTTGRPRASVSQKCSFRIVTIAFCLEIKRLDKTVDALAMLAVAHPEVSFAWTHIGDGPLLNVLKGQAARVLDDVPNATYAFAGRLSNSDVMAFLARFPVDLCVNTSDSEGVPVALMEAMSVGIPVLAPAVGGIPELVQKSCGWLLPAKPSPEDISAALSLAMKSAKSESCREAARRRIELVYDCADNYAHFVSQCLEVFDPP